MDVVGIILEGGCSEAQGVRTVPPLWYFQDNAVSVLEHLDSWRRFFSRHQNFFVSVQIQIGRKNFLVRILAILPPSRWH